jgi:hypothetical protein
LRQLPLVLSIGIGLCVNQTRAVLEAVMGRETEFVRTPKHGISRKLETWSGKKYRAAKSLTPFVELGMAGYFVLAVKVALEHSHYVSVPFLLLFLFGFAYVGALSAWQGTFGQLVRRLWARPQIAPTLVAAPLTPAMPDGTPSPVLITSARSLRSELEASSRSARSRGENDPHVSVSV